MKKLLICFIAIIAIAVAVLWFTYHKPVPKIDIVENSELVKIQLLATVNKGEGIEHAFIRQLIYNPKSVNGVKVKIGKKEYDLTCRQDPNDKKAIKKWAQSTAHLIAIASGYVGKNKETRVCKANQLAYIIKIDKDKKYNVDVYLKVTSPNKKISNTILKDHSDNYVKMLRADVKDFFPSYEYIIKTIKQKRK